MKCSLYLSLSDSTAYKQNALYDFDTTNSKKCSIMVRDAEKYFYLHKIHNRFAQEIHPSDSLRGYIIIGVSLCNTPINL